MRKLNEKQELELLHDRFANDRSFGIVKIIAIALFVVGVAFLFVGLF